MVRMGEILVSETTKRANLVAPKTCGCRNTIRFPASIRTIVQRSHLRHAVNNFRGSPMDTRSSTIGLRGASDIACHR